jgi:hypothetical protein
MLVDDVEPISLMAARASGNPLRHIAHTSDASRQLIETLAKRVDGQPATALTGLSMISSARDCVGPQHTMSSSIMTTIGFLGRVLASRNASLTIAVTSTWSAWAICSISSSGVGACQRIPAGAVSVSGWRPRPLLARVGWFMVLVLAEFGLYCGHGRAALPGARSMIDPDLYFGPHPWEGVIFYPLGPWVDRVEHLEGGCVLYRLEGFAPTRKTNNPVTICDRRREAPGSQSDSARCLIQAESPDSEPSV